MTLSHLDLFAKEKSAYKLMPKSTLLDHKIMMWVIKDIYISPHKALLHKLTSKKVVFRYLKAKKYISKREKYTIFDLINYFSACLMDEIEEGRIKKC